MADKSVSQNYPKNPDPQVKRVSGDDITHPQEQQNLTGQDPTEPDRMAGSH